MSRGESTELEKSTFWGSKVGLSESFRAHVFFGGGDGRHEVL